jgi:hypothetical protein
MAARYERADNDDDDEAGEWLLPSSSSQPPRPPPPPLTAEERQRAFAAASATILDVQAGRGMRLLTATELQQWLRRRENAGGAGGDGHGGALELVRRRADAQEAAASWLLPNSVESEVDTGERHRSPCVAHCMGVFSLATLVAGYVVASSGDGDGGDGDGDRLLLWTGLAFALLHVILTACSPNTMNACV